MTELLPGALIISRGMTVLLLVSICSDTTVLSQNVILMDGHETPSYLLTLLVDY